MKPEEIQALLDLQELDLKLIEYEKHQGELPSLVEEIEGPLERAREAREKAEAELAMARTQHRHVESELLTNNAQFKKVQTRQMGVRNEIEYEAFQHEMEALKDRQDTLEESGLKWIEREQGANERLPEAAEIFDVAEKAASDRRGALDEKTSELRRIHDEAAELQAPLLEQVPAPVISYYKRLRRAGKVPFVAVVSRGACGGCGHRHPPQKLQEIKRNARLTTCEQCGRIQVWREQDEEQIGF